MKLKGFTSTEAISYEFQKCNEDKEFAIYFICLYIVGCLSIPVLSQLHSEKKLDFKLCLVPDTVHPKPDHPKAFLFVQNDSKGIS